MEFVPNKDKADNLSYEIPLKDENDKVVATQKVSLSHEEGNENSFVFTPEGDKEPILIIDPKTNVLTLNNKGHQFDSLSKDEQVNIPISKITMDANNNLTFTAQTADGSNVDYKVDGNSISRIDKENNKSKETPLYATNKSINVGLPQNFDQVLKQDNFKCKEYPYQMMDMLEKNFHYEVFRSEDNKLKLLKDPEGNLLLARGSKIVPVYGAEYLQKGDKSVLGLYTNNAKGVDNGKGTEGVGFKMTKKELERFAQIIDNKSLDQLNDANKSNVNFKRTNANKDITKKIKHVNENENVQPGPGITPPPGPQPTPQGPEQTPPEQQPGQEPGKEPGQQPGQEPGKEPGQEPGQQPGQEPGQQPGQQPGQEPGKEPGQEPGQQPGQQPGQEPGQQPGQEPGKEPGDRIIPSNPGEENPPDNPNDGSNPPDSPNEGTNPEEQEPEPKQDTPTPPEEAPKAEPKPKEEPKNDKGKKKGLSPLMRLTRAALYMTFIIMMTAAAFVGLSPVMLLVAMAVLSIATAMTADNLGVQLGKPTLRDLFHRKSKEELLEKSKHHDLSYHKAMKRYKLLDKEAKNTLTPKERKQLDRLNAEYKKDPLSKSERKRLNKLQALDGPVAQHLREQAEQAKALTARQDQQFENDKNKYLNGITSNIENRQNILNMASEGKLNLTPEQMTSLKTEVAQFSQYRDSISNDVLNKSKPQNETVVRDLEVNESKIGTGETFFSDHNVEDIEMSTFQEGLDKYKEDHPAPKISDTYSSIIDQNQELFAPKNQQTQQQTQPTQKQPLDQQR